MLTTNGWTNPVARMTELPPQRPALDGGLPPAASVNAARIEELARIIEAYSEVTEKLQRSHAQLQLTVQSLRNELSEKNRQLERKKRLAALGEMAAGMAHEIRNPLGGIQLYASMLADDVRHMPESARLVQKISSGVKRLEGLVSQVLHFTRETKARPAAIDLSTLIDQSIELAADLARGDIDYHLSGVRPMPVMADPLLLGQAILNLLLNAREAMEGPGAIDIRWSAALPPAQFCLTIRDTGPGIAPKALDRIFNPFFTTKAMGTGLGLAIVHRIIEAHEGTIGVVNAPEGGAKFEIRI